MKKCFAILAAAALACAALPAVAADGEILMCRYKGYSADGQYYYIVAKPFEGDVALLRQLNSTEFGRALFDDLAPGKRFAGETACASRPRDVTEKWFEKLLAGDDFFSGRNNTTLAEWNGGAMVALPWPKPAK